MLRQWEIGHTLLDVTKSPYLQGSTYPRRFFERFYSRKWRQYVPRKVRIRLPIGAVSYFRTAESLLKRSKTLRTHTFTFNIPLYQYSTISPLRLNHIENYHIKWYTTKRKDALRLKTVNYASHTLRKQRCYSKQHNKIQVLWNVMSRRAVNRLQGKRS